MDYRIPELLSDIPRLTCVLIERLVRLFYSLGTFFCCLAGLLSCLLGFDTGLPSRLGSVVTSVFRGRRRLIYCLAGRVSSSFGSFLGFCTRCVSCFLRFLAGLFSRLGLVN